MGQEKIDEALVRLKMLLGIKDDNSDELLFFLITDTVDMILGYCRIDVLPRQLESLVPVITADMYRRKSYGQAETPQVIKSVTQDKRSISFQDNSNDIDNFLKEYYSRLNPFVKRSGRVPSEVG